MLGDLAGAGGPTGWLVGGLATVLEATVVLLVAFAAARLLRSRSAALRHVVWTAGLAAALLLPALEAGLPDRLTLSIPALPAAWVTEAAPSADTAAPPSAAEARRGSPPEVRDGGTRSAASGRERPAATGAGERAGDGWPAAAPWLVVLIWAGGAGLVLARTVWAGLRLARVRGRSELLDDPEWARRVREASEGLGGPDRPPVRVTPEISVPLTCGVLRPTLLLPQEAVDEWPRGRTEAVLAHELGHLLRRDAATHLLTRLACAVYWFHPLVWKAAREAAKERERACDDVVLRAGTRPSEYARELVEIARQAGARALPGPAAVSVAQRGDLEGRVLSVLEDDADRSPASPGSTAAAALPALALTLTLALLAVEPGSAREAGATAREAGAAGSASPPGPGRSTAAVPLQKPDVAGSLVDLLDDPDPAVRAAAAGAVGEMRVRRAVPGLTEALADPSPAVRLEAARALGEIEDPDAVGPLGRALEGDGSRRFKKAVAWALGETESPRAVDALEDALHDVSGRWLRKRIVRAVGETRQPSAVPVLEGLLEGGDPAVRRAALEALVENRTDRAMAAMAAALESDDAELRAMAARALGRGE